MISKYFPKREEFSLRIVLALPKDSKIGFVAISFSFTVSSSLLCFDTSEMYFSTSLAAFWSFFDNKNGQKLAKLN